MMIRIGHGLGVCALLAAAACSSTSSNSPTVGKDAGDAGPTFKLGWSFEDLSAVSGDAGAPDAARPTPPLLGGVRVCVDKHPEIACDTSAADGTFTLSGFAPLANYNLTCEKAGYVKVSKSIQTASTDMQGGQPIDMFTTGTIDKPPGVTLDSTKGSVLFFTIGPVPGNTNPNAFQGVEGVSVSISPTGGVGPLYTGKDGKTIDKSLTATTSGTGYFYNLDPGDYTLTFTDSTLDCQAIKLGFSGYGIPVVNNPQGLQFTVLADHTVDEMGVFCTQKSVIIGTGDGG